MHLYFHIQSQRPYLTLEKDGDFGHKLEVTQATTVHQLVVSGLSLHQAGQVMLAYLGKPSEVEVFDLCF